MVNYAAVPKSKQYPNREDVMSDHNHVEGLVSILQRRRRLDRALSRAVTHKAAIYQIDDDLRRRLRRGETTGSMDRDNFIRLGCYDLKEIARCIRLLEKLRKATNVVVLIETKVDIKPFSIAPSKTEELFIFWTPISPGFVQNTIDDLSISLGLQSDQFKASVEVLNGAWSTAHPEITNTELSIDPTQVWMQMFVGLAGKNHQYMVHHKPRSRNWRTLLISPKEITEWASRHVHSTEVLRMYKEACTLLERSQSTTTPTT